MFRSRLFASDDGLARIAEGDHRQGLRELEGDAESVALLQQALLRWDPGCLPIFGPSGRLDEETVWALARFARESEVAEVDSWLTPQLSGGFSGVSTSDVAFHPTARSAYSAFSGVLDECDDERAFVVISGWDFWPETPIGPGVTIGDALRAVAQRNVRVHALINRFPVVHTLIGSFGAGVGNNTGAVNFLRSIPNSAVIHDGRALHHTPASLGVNAPGVLPIQLGVHHQKAWVVHTGQRTVAWVGGVDFNPTAPGPPPSTTSRRSSRAGRRSMSTRFCVRAGRTIRTGRPRCSSPCSASPPSPGPIAPASPRPSATRSSSPACSARRTCSHPRAAPRRVSS
jgi:hypothetical protein